MSQEMLTEDLMDMKRLLLILRRQAVVIIALTGGIFVLGLLFVLCSTPRYTASASILLDRSVTATVSEISSIKQMGFETASIESEVEIIKSYNVTAEVIKRLKKKGYFENTAETPTAIKNVSDQLLSNLRVSRVGDTYVLSVIYVSDDPQKSADIANTYAETYIAHQLNMSSEMSTRTVSWLQDKINDLGEQAAEARKAISDYRVKYNKIQRERQESIGNGGRKTSPQPHITTADEEVRTEVALSELRTLEQEAATYDTLYDSYLEKLKSISMQETFPLTETRVISYAAPPKNKSHPKSTMILGAALIFGLGSGILAALIRDNFDKTLKRAGQIKKEVGLNFLGFMPRRREAGETLASFATADGTVQKISLYTDSVTTPASLHSEVIRTLVNAADRHDRNTGGKKVIGILSADKGVSKSIVAANLSAFTAQAAPAILLDADLRTDDSLYDTKQQSKLKGLKDILQGTAAMQDVVLRQTDGNLAFLPSFSKDLNATLPYLTADRARNLVEACKAEYDTVVINLPSLLLPAEIYSFASTVDCFVVVAEWGKTLPNALNFYLKQSGIAPEKVLGVILENTDMAKMDKFYGHKRYT